MVLCVKYIFAEYTKQMSKSGEAFRLKNISKLCDSECIHRTGEIRSPMCPAKDVWLIDDVDESYQTYRKPDNNVKYTTSFIFN